MQSHSALRHAATIRPAAAPADPDGVLGLYPKISYGLGDFAYSLPWNMVGAFLLFYYTDVARLPATIIGVVFLSARMFDALVDLAVGVWVDKTRTRMGRTRPFFLLSGAPFAAIFVLTFMVPTGWATGARLAYAFVTFNLLGVLFSLGSVPLTALLPMMTPSPAQRLQLSGWRSAMTALSVIVATATAMPLVAAFGGGDRQRGFVGLAMLFAALSLACSLNLFAACREAERDHAAPGFAIAPAIVQMLRNRAWQVTFAVAALNFVRFGAVLSLTTYFALHVLHAPWTISLLLPAVSGTLLLGAVLAPPILRRFGMRRGWWGAICVAAAFYALLPFAELHPALFVVLFALASLATSVTMTGIFAMGAAAVDYHETLFGVRHEGLLSSGISLATKFGMAVGTAAVAFTLGLAGYRPDHVGGAATAAIRWSYYGWPLAVLAVQAVAITFWPMTADE